MARSGGFSEIVVARSGGFSDIEYSFIRGSSREGHEVSTINSESLNAAANQLDILQFAANPNS